MGWFQKTEASIEEKTFKDKYGSIIDSIIVAI